MEHTVRRRKDSEQTTVSRPISAFTKSILTSRKSLRINKWTEELVEAVSDSLEGFLNSTWEVHHVSPLFGFEGTKIRLKQYSLKLRNFCTLMDVQADVRYSAKFSIQDDLGISKHDKIMKVQVLCREGSSEEVIQIYSGFFMSWGATKYNNRNFLHLPVLVCKAKTVKVKTHIHGALKKFFDCVIEPYFLGETQLIWLNSLFLSLSRDAKRISSNVLKLTMCPAWETRRQKAQLYLSLTDLRKIWTRIHPHENETISFEESRMLYDGIIKTLSENLFIKLSELRIYEIKYPDITVRSTGKFYCKTVQMVSELLRFLYFEKPCINVMTGQVSEDFM